MTNQVMLESCTYVLTYVGYWLDFMLPLTLLYIRYLLTQHTMRIITRQLLQ